MNNLLTELFLFVQTLLCGPYQRCEMQQAPCVNPPCSAMAICALRSKSFCNAIVEDSILRLNINTNLCNLNV